MNILVAEDNVPSRILVVRILRKKGHEVFEAPNGIDAVEILRSQKIDVVFTDWMMPEMDGMELIHYIRENIKPAPVIIVLTAIASEHAQEQVLNAGADEYLAKPIYENELLECLELCMLRQSAPVKKIAYRTAHSGTLPRFAGVCIAASTGGPPAVAEVVSHLAVTDEAAFFIIMHGPKWMLETFAERLDTLNDMPVYLAYSGLAVKPGTIYLAPGDQHTVLDPIKMELLLTNDPPENFVRPSADPLFRSVANRFQSHAIGVVLTGMGHDGSVGCGYIAAAGGRVIAQDPSTAVLPSMPESIINLRIADTVAPLNMMAAAINRLIPEILNNA